MSSKKSPPPIPPFYRPEQYTPEDSIGFLMRHILNDIAALVEVELAHTALTHAQWIPLFKLYTGCAHTVAELARQSHMDAGAMTRLLDRLEAKGLVRRARSERDRRVVQLRLTDAGRAAAQDIPHALCTVQNRALERFTAEEFATLKTLLRRVRANLGGDEKDPT